MHLILSKIQVKRYVVNALNKVKTSCWFNLLCVYGHSQAQTRRPSLFKIIKVRQAA